MLPLLAACTHTTLLPSPPHDATHLRRHLRRLVGLGVQPAQRLQVSQVVVLWQRGRQVDLKRDGREGGAGEWRGGGK